MHLLLLLLLHYRMHLHIITTSPRKGPTRPAAPRELLQSDLLTVYSSTLTWTDGSIRSDVGGKRFCPKENQPLSVLSRTNYQALHAIPYLSLKRLQPPGRLQCSIIQLAANEHLS